MIDSSIKKKIVAIWDSYVCSDKVVHDTKGNVINDIDESRITAIAELKLLLASFLDGSLNVFEFKTALDSYNKRNNLWGFTATKGQMFFNQLTKSNEQNIDRLTSILKRSISEPADLADALKKIEELEKFANTFFSKAKDKRKAPNPGSTGYFLSYFWQIHNHEKWPIIYTSLTKSFKELGIWQDHATQREDYEFFYNLYENIKDVLKEYTGKSISNWDAEHSFWNYTGNPNTPKKSPPNEITSTTIESTEEVKLNANFEITDYLIPKVAVLTQLGSQISKSKGSEFEKLVAEIFKQLDFEVEIYGQGSGREPDAIIKF